MMKKQHIYAILFFAVFSMTGHATNLSESPEDSVYEVKNHQWLSGLGIELIIKDSYSDKGHKQKWLIFRGDRKDLCSFVEVIAVIEKDGSSLASFLSYDVSDASIILDDNVRVVLFLTVYKETGVIQKGDYKVIIEGP